ncbi:MAG TPA: sodium-independent anion transporter [Longimicrobium sp.]
MLVPKLFTVLREYDRRRLVPDLKAGAGRWGGAEGVEVYEIDGPFFFGAAEKFRETIVSVEGKQRMLVIVMERVPAIDSTGIRALRSVVRRAKKEGTLVILAGVHAQPMVALGKAELLDEVGDENLCGRLPDALDRARRHLGLLPPAAPNVESPDREPCRCLTP